MNSEKQKISRVIGVASVSDCPYCPIWLADECDGNPEKRMKMFQDCPLYAAELRGD